MIAYENAGAAIDWLTSAFAFRERGPHYTMENGTIDGVLVLVDDRDAHHARAVDAGATVIRPPEEGPEGRLYTAEDLKGHRWMLEQQ